VPAMGCSGGSTVPAAVDRRRIGAISIVIAGIAALSVYRWYVAVRCQRRVVIVGRTFGARSINWSLDYRRIGAIVWSVGL
jgi:hypothetical protein